MPIQTLWKISEAKSVIDAATNLANAIGVNESIKGCSGTFRAAKVDDFELVMSTPFSGIRTGDGNYRYGLDIWWAKNEGGRKVFSAWWDPAQKWADPFCLVTFKNGPWLSTFLALQNSIHRTQPEIGHWLH